ncbi:MAG TPA: hypothetical protein VML55_21605 [Planctomycetaceae bacterium]|nr:hypothetical protein [Planctomycetaceae bacterium]
MPEFIAELTTIAGRLDQIRRSTARELLWEDPARACQPFWDAAVFAGHARQTAAAPPITRPDDDLPRPVLVLSAKPFVEQRAPRSRTR